MLLTAPVFRDGRNGTDNDTMASMVFDSKSLHMRIRFKGDDLGAFRRYHIGAAERPQPTGDDGAAGEDQVKIYL